MVDDMNQEGVKKAMETPEATFIRKIEERARYKAQISNYVLGPASQHTIQILTTRKLRKAIDTFNSRSSLLAGAMLILAIIQIGLLIWQIVRN